MANPDYAGKQFGSNAAAWWGFHYKDLLTEPKLREVITIYEIDATGEKNWATAVYNFRWVPQTDPFGVVHKIIDYPGVPVNHQYVQENHGVLKNVGVRLRPHFGTLGLAPSEADMVDSIPPSYTGGNMDNWRIGKGAIMYYPVAVPAPCSWPAIPMLRRGFRTLRDGHRMLADRHVPAHRPQEGHADGDYVGGPALSSPGNAGRMVHARIQLRELPRRSWARKPKAKFTANRPSTSPCGTLSARCVTS